MCCGSCEVARGITSTDFSLSPVAAALGERRGKRKREARTDPPFRFPLHYFFTCSFKNCLTTMSSTSLAPPTFDLPSDNSDYEVWCLRAPAHLDVSEVLNGVTLNVNTKLLKDTSPSSTTAADTSTNNSTLTKFKSKQDDQEYELSIADSSEINHLRLLLPHQDDDDDSSSTQKLKAHSTPFQRYIHLTSVTTSSQEELVLAPARENAPRPAFGEMMGVNGSVPAMRLAYVPVPQKEGLKRRWAMPGSSGGMSTVKPVKRVKVADEQEQEQQQPATPSKSAKKKKKEKKEKKSKKSPKK